MKSLRNASSLILTAPSIVARNLTNHDGVSLLAIKRSATSSHFPNAHVFPGGNIDPADHVSEWLSVLPPNELDVHMSIVGEKQSSSDPPEHHIPAAVSLRITAIRETFEECGILLCTRKEGKSSIKVSHFELEDANFWRQKIRDDPHEFLNLCRTYDCFPSVKGLYFFNNWITPVRFLRRYDCKFFIAVMDQQIQGEADGLEIETIEWHSFDYFLANDRVFLPPPQLYGMNMLAKLKDISEVCKFAMYADTQICQPFIPCLINLMDGMVIILPGDEKYEDLKRRETEKITYDDCSISDYRGEVMHRLEFNENGKNGLVINNCVPRHYDVLNLGLSKIDSKI